MTPAERDEVRGMATMRACCSDATPDPCSSDTCVLARAVLRYVPAGVAAHRDVRPLPVESDLPPSFRRIVAIGGVHLQPDGARAAAHALNAAADAAEDSKP